MGFNWMDVANVAVGAIDRDREITKEDLAIRADNLKAERDSLIRRKDAKYDYELKKFYKEKEKADEISSLNTEFENIKSAGGTFDRDEYADRYLMIKLGVDKYNALSDNRKKVLRSEFGNDIRGYEFDKKYLENYEAKADADKKQILKSYSDELSNAKGDSFLINTILSKTPWKKKETEKISLLDNETKTDSDEKVETTIQEVEKSDTTDTKDTTDTTDTTEVKEVKTSKYKLDETPPIFDPSKDWKTAYKDAKKNTQWNLNNDTTYSYLSLLGQFGGADELSLKFNKTDSGIDGHNANSIAQINFIKSQFNILKNQKTDKIIFSQVGENYQRIGDLVNTDTNYDELLTILNDGRNGNIIEDVKTGLGGDIRLTTFVPLSVADNVGNLTINGVTIGSLDKSQLKNLNTEMNNWLLSKVEGVKLGKGQTHQGLLERNYASLYNGNTSSLNDFGKYLLENNASYKKAYDAANVTEGVAETKTTSVDKTVAPDTVANEEQIKKDIADNKIRTVIVTIDGEKKEVPLTDKNKEILNANKIDYSVKEDKTTGDASIATEMEALLRKDKKKIVPKDIGKVNQPVFESLQEIVEILPNEMTGKEIKEKYEINFYIPDRAIFKPKQFISERYR
jgi:hypothetical protein